MLWLSDKAILVGTVVGLGLYNGGLVLILKLLGFRSSGVAAGSTAAAVQSVLGSTVAGKAAGGLFAAAQLSEQQGGRQLPRLGLW